MKCRRMPPSGWVPSWPRRSKKQHRKPQKTAGSTEPTSPVLPEIFPVWVLFGSNQISKNSIRQKSDGKQEKTLGFPKKPEGQWSECRDSNPGPLGPEDSAEKSGGTFHPVWCCLFQKRLLFKPLPSHASIRFPHSLGHHLGLGLCTAILLIFPLYFQDHIHKKFCITIGKPGRSVIFFRHHGDGRQPDPPPVVPRGAIPVFPFAHMAVKAVRGHDIQAVFLPQLCGQAEPALSRPQRLAALDPIFQQVSKQAGQVKLRYGHRIGKLDLPVCFDLGRKPPSPRNIRTGRSAWRWRSS